MTLVTGKHFVGGQRSAEGTDSFEASNPATGETLDGRFLEAADSEIDRSLALADESFAALQQAPAETIAGLLDKIADGIEAAGDALLARAHAETALPMPRLTGERARTVGQTRRFAAIVREGSWRQARIDRSDPARTPLPKPDVRTMLHAVGPVVVFGASNFPLAISVAGTDTVSALAARCPVVVKAHPAHPGTCEMLAAVIDQAVRDAGLPAGVFSLLHGRSHRVGAALVTHPKASAVAFTGSLKGGRALADAVAARPQPIPIYAEMGSVNPVFVLPSALEQRGDAIAEGYLQSVNLGVGQFCTNPGLLLAAGGPPLDRFLKAAGEKAAAAPAATMLHDGIRSAYQEGVASIRDTPGVEAVGPARAAAGDANQAACSLFTAPLSLLAEHESLAAENFGPSSIVLRCESPDDMLAFAEQMEGSLTATIHGTEQDLQDHAPLVRLLERKAGRLIFNGFPTGIEVCAAMHHGGPYPATTHSGFTSIGNAAIYRFASPVCYQDFPDSALPAELQNANPLGLMRLVDGQPSSAPLPSAG
ncbi:NADP-dependent fatty aldehyde dehydrogenase [Pseudobythopirellula maris]|uniref:NADP-dependent fatty aldehyde dehydrogenase n=1 Tax=Pseudobythopirellula maris TaxID=2527991 RepID=A0A5C5ZT60_9BACT|nr:aldehyde dehydrogenase (NADP(+)) [Pseudobythopirellula maris]TWT90217.1 NADP-dependent fatty aldehyde dehydrogenase [Pseudobythopirellula maris]